MNRLHVALLLSAGAALGQAQTTTITINTRLNQHAISPLIYGAAFPSPGQLEDLNFTVSRFGGNEASSYNWLENCAAKGADWYFESWPNDSSAVAGEAVDSFISQIKSEHGSPIVTMPMLNYVGKLGANRAVDWSYSVAKYGAQTGSDPYNSDAGNGILASTGQPVVNNVSDANTPNSLTMQTDWLKHLISTWGLSQNGGIRYYVMDNEPSIWYSTHMDVHPVGETYDELGSDYETYGAAIRAADPNAIIAGPEEWGWTGYFYSGYDMQYASTHGWGGPLPDRSKHGNMDNIPWLLEDCANYQKATGKQILNMLSLHYYPQQGEYSDDDSAAMQTIRNRSTRSLWDPNYVDTSWIDSVVMLIPRMQSWVSTYYPGLQTAITEYNWGDEGEMNGATTQADILGIFGRENLDMSSRWTTPATGSPTYLAMKMYRNYDGNDSTFGSLSVECSAPDPDQVSAFAALQGANGALTVMLINKLTTASPVQLSIAGYGGPDSAAAWQISPSSSSAIAQLSTKQVPGSGFSVTLPPQSVTVYVLTPNNAALMNLALTSPVGGQSATGTVTIYQPAPAGGLTVTLASDDTNYVTVPASVLVPAGQTTASFPITTKAYVANYQVGITASDSVSSYLGILSVSDDSVTAVSVSPTPVTGGTSSTGTVTLVNAAPTGGWTVKLASSDTSAATVPATVTIPAGAKSATFTITTTAVSTATSVTVTASDALSKKTTTLIVNP